MATKRSMKGWDTRVQEADREPLEFTMEGKKVTVLPLLGSDVEQLQAAQADGDFDAQLRVIFRDDAPHVKKVLADAPFAAGSGLIEDILVEFGVISGNR